MHSKGTQRADDRPGVARHWRKPLALSLALHVLLLAGALWWAAQRVAPAPKTLIGCIDLRPTVEEPQVLPEDDALEPPPLEDVIAEVDPLESLLPSDPELDEEQLPEEPSDDSAPEPPRFEPVPLSAVRARRPPPDPTPLPPPQPVAAPARPPPRPPPLRLRPSPPRPLPSPPRVAPVPARRSPLRVVWAPDPRRYYPPSALQRGIGGRAIVRLTIDAQGRVLTAQIAQTSGHALLDRAALALARAFRFTTGSALRSTRLPVTFRPPGGGFGS